MTPGSVRGKDPRGEPGMTRATSEEARKMADEKLEEIKQHVKDQDMDKAEEALEELKTKLEDAPPEAKEAMRKAVEAGEAAIQAAKSAGEQGREALENLTGGDE